jgi:hypothetical protein
MIRTDTLWGSGTESMREEWLVVAAHLHVNQGRRTADLGPTKILKNSLLYTQDPFLPVGPVL